MRVERVDVGPVPGSPAHVRLAAEVSYGDGTAESYWFEVERDLEPALSRGGDPWLACLLPLAITLGEPLEIPVPVDPLLYENAVNLMHIWKTWYPRLQIVPLRVPVAGPAADGTEERAGVFFSCGVDSFFSVLRHGDGRAPAPLHLDDLIFVWGADIAIGNTAGFLRARASAAQAAGELGKRLVPVATNLRETRWKKTDWAYLSHGAALGAIALTLENRYRRVLIASSMPYYRLQPWGSHPLTDPLFSTSRLRIIHDGAFLARLEKVGAIISSDVAMRHLRVCWRSEDGVNCGRCDKCTRTMAILSVLGALDRCATFRADQFQVERVARVYSKTAGMGVMRELERLARAKGRADLTRAARQSMKNSRRMHALLPLLRRIEPRPIVGPLASRIETRLLARVLP